MMTLKTAAFLALIGMILVTVLVAVDFVITITGILQNVVPAMSLLTSLIHLFASLTLAVFFYVFQKAQS